jgi:nucleolysin TIA-1/TIAR
VTAGAGQYPYGYGQQMSYWYPQGYHQMQGQFLQPQYYSQYYGQQAQYMNSMRMPTPSTGAWQPTQATAAPPTASAPLPPGQPPTMVTYATMPHQYPTQWSCSLTG